MRESTVGAFLVFGAAAGFGTIGIFGELAIAIDLELATLLPVRFAVATIIVSTIGIARGWTFPSGAREWAATLALGVAYTAMTVCFFVSLRSLTAGIATIVLYTYPAFVVGLSAPLLGEAITVRKLLSLGLAMIGVAFVVGSGSISIQPVGIALALGAAVFYALYTTGSRSLSPRLAPRTLMLGILVGTTASMLVYGALDGGLAVPVGSAEISVVLGIATISTVIPHLLFYEGVARLEASRVGLVSTVEPVVTVVLGAVLLGEPITVFVVAGGALVLMGVVLVQSGSTEPEAFPEAPALSDSDEGSSG